MSDTALDALADAAGIEPRYWDIQGRLHERNPDTARLLLRALHMPADTEGDVRDSLIALTQAPWRETIPPVVIATESQAVSVPLRFEAGAFPPSLRWTIACEDGAVVHGELQCDTLPVVARSEVEGAAAVELRMLPLPPQPAGYHRLRIAAHADHAADLIVAPARCHLPPEGRRFWGVSAQLYALRSRNDRGIGDFGSLGALIRWSAGHRADFVGLNPLHALFWDTPENASPYSPASRQFLNPLYLDIEAIPDFAEAGRVHGWSDAPLSGEDGGDYVDYTRVATRKAAALHDLHLRFEDRHLRAGSARGRAFEAFVATGGSDLVHFATFQALGLRLGMHDWPLWPAALRDPASAEVARFRRENEADIRFFEYLQWQCELQLAEAERTAASSTRFGLYGDLAVGSDSSSADIWADRKAYLEGVRVGAPPDPFNEKGQEWGVAPFDPVGLRATGYRRFSALLEANMRHAGILRVDHVMGWDRLFLIPAGGAPKDGAYLRYPLADMLAVAALESQRNRCVIVGEDLGTVREGFRETMAATGILSYRVLYFEKDHGGFRKPADLPALAMASATTHDLATLRGYWLCEDIAVKARLGIIPPGDNEDHLRRVREADKRQLVLALQNEGLLPDGFDVGHAPWTTELARAIHAYLAKSPCLFVDVRLDDLLEETQQTNLPGTFAEYPNWRRRLGRAIEEFRDDPSIAATLSTVERTRIM